VSTRRFLPILLCVAGVAGAQESLVLHGTFSDAYYTRSLLPGLVVDARDATFVACSQPDPMNPCTPNPYPVNLGPIAATGGLWTGGRVIGANRVDATWAEMHVTGGDGTYCVTLDTGSSNGVQYDSREAATGRPTVVVTVAP